MPPENSDWHNRVGEWGCGFGKENRVMIENIERRIGALASSERVDNIVKMVGTHADKLDRIQWLLVTNLVAIGLGLFWLVLKQ